MKKDKSVFDSRDFKAEFAAWDNLLGKEGFEKTGKEELVIQSQNFHNNSYRTQVAAGPQIYEICQEILRVYKFRREFYRVIITEYGAGKSLKEIVISLSKARSAPSKITREAVFYIIHRIKEDFRRNY